MSRFTKRFTLLVAVMIGLMAVLFVAPSAQAATVAPTIIEVQLPNSAIIKVTGVNGTVVSGFARALSTNERILLNKSGNSLQGTATVAGTWRVTAIVKDSAGNISTKNKDVVAVPVPVVNIVDESVGSDTIDAFWYKTKGVEGRTITFDEQGGPGILNMDVSEYADGDGASLTITGSNVWCVTVTTNVGAEFNSSVADCAYFTTL